MYLAPLVRILMKLNPKAQKLSQLQLLLLIVYLSAPAHPPFSNFQCLFLQIGYANVFPHSCCKLGVAPPLLYCLLIAKPFLNPHLHQCPPPHRGNVALTWAHGSCSPDIEVINQLTVYSQIRRVMRYHYSVHWLPWLNYPLCSNGTKEQCQMCNTSNVVKKPLLVQLLHLNHSVEHV